MRDKLNDNPLLQAAVIGALLIGVAFFVISSTGGGEEESGGGEAEAKVSAAGTQASGAAEGSASQSLSSALAAVAGAGSETPPLPHAVLTAWHANRTLVLLFVRDGGIDDRLTKLAARGVAGFGGVALFVVPAHRISRYAAITEGLGVDRVPALVVVTPRHLNRVVPTASVSYGFQSAASIRQAVIDAGYKGPTVDYHP
jgi:hypothetical protein